MRKNMINIFALYLGILAIAFMAGCDQNNKGGSSNSSFSPPQKSNNAQELIPLILGGIALGTNLVSLGAVIYTLSFHRKRADGFEKRLNKLNSEIEADMDQIDRKLNELQRLSGESISQVSKNKKILKEIQLTQNDFGNQINHINLQTQTTLNNIASFFGRKEQAYPQLTKQNMELIIESSDERDIGYVNDSSNKIPLSLQLQELIQQFNNQNRDYFRNAQYSPLKLSQESNHGKIGLDARPVIHLELSQDANQASYLRIDLEGNSWLIPNILSSFFGQIINGLNDYPDIFKLVHNSGQRLLVKPAKLKLIGTETWEIESAGEFYS